MNTKNIYFLVGESGSGKTSVSERLEEKYGLTAIQSYTTRPERYEGESGHVFISDKEFDKLQNLIGYTKFDTFRYCATTDQVEQNSLYVIDPSGITYFKRHYHGNKKAYVIYIYTSLTNRVLRMKQRGDTRDKIIRRLINDHDSFEGVKENANISIDNDDLEKCVESCYHYIIEKEMLNE